MCHFKLSTIALAACILLLGPFGFAGTSSAADDKRYMISHAPGQGGQALGVIKNNNGKRVKKLKYRDLIAADLSEKDLKKILRHPLFSNSKHELDPRRYMTANSFSETIPYGISMVQAAPGSGLAPGSLARKVCIIDSGYEIEHEDLPGRSRVTGMSQTGDAWDYPGNSHGTHVAGTIAALGNNNTGVIGVHTGENLALHIVKVFNDSGSWTFGSDLIDALDDCVAEGSQIVSMSLGGGGASSSENQAFAEALAAGVLSIAAASNDGDTSYSYPASYDSVVSVAAIDSGKNRASFSNRNDQVELAAPGVAVDSTTVGNSYAQYSGTSMATPHVSGAAALLWSNHGACTAGQIRQALAVSAEDLGAAGPDDSYGYGLIQVKDASAVITQYGCSNLPDYPVTPPPPPPQELANGETVTNLSGSTGDEQFFSVTLPAGANNLVVQTSGPNGDADLYLRGGALPTVNEWDCRPYSAGSSESCSVASPSFVTYYIMVRAYSSYSGLSLTVNYEGSGPPANQPPVASIDASPVSGKAPLVVSFDGSGSSDDAGISNWLWDFGDGASGSGETTSHTYTTAGEYTATLTVSDGEFSDSANVVISVAPANQAPSAGFTVSPADGIDTDTSVSFDASASSDPDGDSLQYAWNFGDGSSASGMTASHTFGTAGTYTVTLEVNDGDGGVDSTSQSVSVVDAPEPPPASISISVSLNRKGTRASISWSGADGSRVRILRNGSQVTRTRNDGFWRDRYYISGDSYQVCNDALSVCSEVAAP